MNKKKEKKTKFWLKLRVQREGFCFWSKNDRIAKKREFWLKKGHLLEKKQHSDYERQNYNRIMSWKSEIWD